MEIEKGVKHKASGRGKGRKREEGRGEEYGKGEGDGSNKKDQREEERISIFCSGIELCGMGVALLNYHIAAQISVDPGRDQSMC